MKEMLHQFFVMVYRYTVSWHDRQTILFGLILSSLVLNIAGLILPLTILQLYDRIIPNHSTASLLILVVIVLFALAIEMFLSLSRNIFITWSAARYAFNTTN
ncbi:hypothetical protein, partial [Corynebacterium parakroppenstedtii]|uniref:hypothetical protein n=1 Tax=Corynebacterium parakroppenstedtii TaxID=2828363 RepID=UPI001F3CE7CA